MSRRNVVRADAMTDEHGPAPPTSGGGEFTESEQRRRWLDAFSELLPSLLSSQAGPPYALIAQYAATAATADFAVLAVPYGADRVIVAGVTGELTAGMANRTAPLTGSLTGQAILTGQPSLVTGDRRAAAAAALGAATGPLIVVPLAAGEQVRGALMLGRLATSPSFTETDLAATVSFADHAAVVMELARARTDQLTLAQVEDHDRIAGDLHDHVIKELFALGLTLQSHAARADPATADRINGYVDTLDEIIKKIRTSIFGLHRSRHPPAGLPARLRDLIEEHTPQLGFTAGLRFAGPLDPSPDETLTHDILAVTREALSNCARHAQATAVSVSLTRQDGLITLGITDNGRGLGTPARTSGLASMRRRAARHGGTLLLTIPADGGTHLTWTASVQKKSNQLPNGPWFPQSVNPRTIPWQAGERPGGRCRQRASCGHSPRARIQPGQDPPARRAARARRPRSCIPCGPSTGPGHRAAPPHARARAGSARTRSSRHRRLPAGT
jgi:signal transduction histidine kinase